MTSMRRRMIEDLRIRGYAESTQKDYVRLVARFARHFGRPPEQLGVKEIRDFQVHLVMRTGASYGVQSHLLIG